jgi:hypothetical protein
VPSMRSITVKPRSVALLTGGVLAASAFLPMLGVATARADEKSDRKSRQYKTGALVLGAATAYFALKSKKTVPAIVAGAGAYYAYKKSKDLKNRPGRYGYNPGQRDPNRNYPDRNYPDPQYSNPDRDAQYPTDDTDGYYNNRNRDDRNRDAQPANYPDDDNGYGDNGYNNPDSNNDGRGTYADNGDAYSRAQLPDYSTRTLAARRKSGSRIKVK